MGVVTDIRRALADLLQHEQTTVVPAPAEYGNHLDTLTFAVTITVGIDTPEARDHLDDLLDPETGAKHLLEADRTLTGLVADLAVVKSTGYQLIPQGPDDPPLLGATWTVACTRS